eukprot:1177696-Rhodomonas_salina.1
MAGRFEIARDRSLRGRGFRDERVRFPVTVPDCCALTLGIVLRIALYRDGEYGGLLCTETRGYRLRCTELGHGSRDCVVLKWGTALRIALY